MGFRCRHARCCCLRPRRHACVLALIETNVEKIRTEHQLKNNTLRGYSSRVCVCVCVCVCAWVERPRCPNAECVVGQPSGAISSAARRACSARPSFAATTFAAASPPTVAPPSRWRSRASGPRPSRRLLDPTHRRPRDAHNNRDTIVGKPYTSRPDFLAR